LDDAAAAYWATVAELDELKARIPAVRLRMVDEREWLAREIVDEARAGASQKELLARSRYQSREMIRRILRRAGIEPDKD
jgi:hypothetical protein